MARVALAPERRQAAARTDARHPPRQPAGARGLAARSRRRLRLDAARGRRASATCGIGTRINSTDLVTRLRDEKSVLLVPGDHFGMDHYLRIGFGEPPDYVTAGLARVHDLLESLAEASAWPRRAHERASAVARPGRASATSGSASCKLLTEVAERLDFEWRVVAIAHAPTRLGDRSGRAWTSLAPSSLVAAGSVARSTRRGTARSAVGST